MSMLVLSSLLLVNLGQSLNLKVDRDIRGDLTHLVTGTLALQDSDNFIDESDASWLRRQERQRRQMQRQKAQLISSNQRCSPGNNAYCPDNYFWQVHYEPTFSCPNEERIGLMGDGGKWVCEAYKVTEKAEADEGCLVYSVGSSGRYDFEQYVHKRISKKCEIHTFDLANWTTYTNNPPPQYMNYHVTTIGAAEDGNTPIPAIVNQLGHTGRPIDLFKIDCEGCEWDTYKTWLDQGVEMKQILVELHGPTKHMAKTHEFFAFLFSKGYVVFHKEPNVVDNGNCVEYAFIKLTPEFAQLGWM